MSEIRFDSEKELVEGIKQSQVYKDFSSKYIGPKIDREKEAWRLLSEHRGQYTREILNQVFDTVDLDPNNKRWFGSLLAAPNRNLILGSEPSLINQWFEELLFSGKDPSVSLNTCMKQFKIKGASKGLATLLLYLSNPEKYSIWVNATQEGLVVLGRVTDLKGQDWGKNYTQFNSEAIDFRENHGFQPQETDWFLTFISSYIESEDNYFRVDEETLRSEPITIPGDDESDIDDVVGEPMELRVMRWTPTNEMGVVALFIEFRKQLGFPIIEVIRTRFPDAAVFESSSKGYIRRYIEFEFRSSGYRAHLKTKRRCHYVVCWENDWKDCPIPVFELKQMIPDIIKTENDKLEAQQCG